jgi:hypothetical protein
VKVTFSLPDKRIYPRILMELTDEKQGDDGNPFLNSPNGHLAVSDSAEGISSPKALQNFGFAWRFLGGWFAEHVRLLLAVLKGREFGGPGRQVRPR